MKKTRLTTFIGALLAVVMCFTACGTAKNDSSADGESVKQLEAGEITYENAVCESIINMEDSGTVATAVASNGAPVVYSFMDDGEADKFRNAFDSALSIATDGTITGKFTAIKKFKVKITASAEKCQPVTAEITVSVVNPHLNYVGRQLTDARVGVQYASSVAYVQDEDVDVTYTMVKGYALPEGLSMSRDGTITGTPVTVGPGQPFRVNAAGKGFSATEAEFTIDVVIDHQSTTPSRIVNFGDKEGEKAIDVAYVGSQYVSRGVADNASALNDNNIVYTLAEGSALPEGMTLYPNGTIIGKATERNTYTFYVVATAVGCDSVTKGFVLTVSPRRIKFESTNGELTKGEPADYSIATADAGEGVEITYSMTEEDAAELKANYGLELTENGTIIGTPTVVVELMSFRVTAQAEGFTPTTVVKYFRINEPLQAPANGRFEAEYISLIGKRGTGYSASPSGKDIIDTTLEGKNVSNGAFINYLHNDTITLEFVIYAEKAVSAPLYIQMSSEMGNVTLTPSGFGVYTYAGQTTDGAKTTVNYGSVNVNGGDMVYADFKEYRFGTVDLVAGWNVIQLAVHTNSYRGSGVTGGPGIDYIRIDSDASLKWVPCTYNVSKG